MPKVRAKNITLNYEQQGSGEPLILIPFLTAENACYSFQVTDYAKHFTCISLDLRGTGESDKPKADYSTEDLADDVAAFMQATNLPSAHVAGLSLGGVVSLWLGAKYPAKVKSLSVHSGWTKTDLFLETVIESWQTNARALGSVPEMVVQSILPWCLTPELYAQSPEFVQGLCAFVRSRPAQTVDGFILQSRAVLSHDVEAQLSRITAPTQITFGSHDMITSRFAEPMTSQIGSSELVIFENCAHTPMYEKIEEFNQRTLEFLRERTVQRASKSM